MRRCWAGTNSSRGSSAMTWSTRSSVIPCVRSCSATIRSPRWLVLIRPGRILAETTKLASLAPANVPAALRRPVKQRSRLLRRTGPPHMRVGFVHPSEQEFARFLDYYRIRWVYEPASFPIGWEDGPVNEMFTPHFYLPESDMYVDLTTMSQSRLNPQNRKAR